MIKNISTESTVTADAMTAAPAKPETNEGSSQDRGDGNTVRKETDGKQYSRVSKDGDTLEITASELISASESKLKQLYSNRQITKQQYDKYMKIRSGGV